MKWTKKVAFHFIEEALLNSFLLKKKFDITKHFLKFKLEAISSLLAAAGTDVAAPAATDRLSRCHFPELIPPMPMKQNPQKRCVVCTQNKGERRAYINVGTALKSQDSVLHHVFSCSIHNLTSTAPKLCFLHYNKDCLQ